MLDARNLVMTYGDFTAVRDVSFQVDAGEVVSLIGPNGAGKTTTIHMVTGVLPPTEGEVRVGGVRLTRDALTARRRMGYVPDRPQTYETLTGLEFCEFVAGIYGLSAREARQRALPLFDRFRLADDKDDLMGSYSHGMRQKALLIATLCHEPDVLVLDEPIVGLDPYSGRVLRELIAEQAEAGRAILFSSHVLQIAEQVADRVLVMDRGRIRAEGSVDQLRRRVQGDESDPLEDVFFRLTEEADEGYARAS